MEKINTIVSNRNKNYLLYQNTIVNDYWKIKPTEKSFVSNFAYPIITPKIDDLVKSLKENNIETRPLICGSIANQPFWKKMNYDTPDDLNVAHEIDKYGLYLPNNHQLTNEEIIFVCDVVNKVLND